MPHNNGQYSQDIEDTQTEMQKKAQFEDQIFMCDAPSPRNPHEYLHNLKTLYCQKVDFLLNILAADSMGLSSLVFSQFNFQKSQSLALDVHSRS